MIACAWYLLKVTICSAVLFGYYWFFLRNKVFHTYNRFFLLATVILSLILPTINIEVNRAVMQDQPVLVKLLDVVAQNEEPVVLPAAPTVTSVTTVDYRRLIVYAYLLLSFLLLFHLCRGLVRIFMLIRKYPNYREGHLRIVETENEPGTPFSFFRYIFQNAETIDSVAKQRILAHESAHVSQLHSADNVFMQTVLAAAWCNPVFWLIRKELHVIHEFIADEKAVEHGDTAAFASMLLTASYPQTQFSLTNQFFRSPVKRRLMMIASKRKQHLNYISRLLVLPIATVLFSAFMLKEKAVERTVEAIPTIFSPKQSALPQADTEPTHPENKIQGAGTFRQTSRSVTVVLDAGHGGTDMGARNHSGLDYLEKDLTLQLIKRTAAMNENKNIKLILLRETDVYQSPAEKVKLATSYNPDLFISVHLDGSPEPYWQKSSGLAVFVNSAKAERISDQALASAIVASFRTNYGIPVEPKLRARKFTPLILRDNPFPAVIVEAGFITNNRDASYLHSEAGQKTFAMNLLSAINAFAEASPQRAILNDGKTTIADTIIIQNPKELSDTVILAQPARVFSDPADDPILFLGTIKKPRASIEELKKQTELKLSGNFGLESATLYFSGPDFPLVQIVKLTGNSLEPARSFIDRVKPGNSITFSNIIVAGTKGRMTISDQSFTFY